MHKDAFLALAQWISILPYYTRLKFIEDSLTIAGLNDNDKYIYILLEWILRHPQLEENDVKRRLLDQVYDLQEKKKKYANRFPYMPQDFWFATNSGLYLPLQSLLFDTVRVEFDLNNVENFTSVERNNK